MSAFFMLLLSSVDFFQNKLFQKNSYRNTYTISVSNSFDQDQGQQNDLGSN